MLMLMECPSHMGTLHVNTSGHMLVTLMILLQTVIHLVVHVNKALLPSLHHNYVGTDYYCESGTHSCCPVSLFYNDPLWDGQQCGGGGAPCCTHPNMPWFIKTLNETTTEDIELRVCKDHNSPGDTPLELIELFVQ